jgi:hypothetical protein
MGFTLEKEGQYPLAPEEITVAEVLKKRRLRYWSLWEMGIRLPRV